MEKFKEINKSPKDNEKNLDRKSNLKEFISIFNKIADDADIIIKKIIIQLSNFMELYFAI